MPAFDFGDWFGSLLAFVLMAWVVYVQVVGLRQYEYCNAVFVCVSKKRKNTNKLNGAFIGPMTQLSYLTLVYRETCLELDNLKNIIGEEQEKVVKCESALVELNQKLDDAKEEADEYFSWFCDYRHKYIIQDKALNKALKDAAVVQRRTDKKVIHRDNKIMNLEGIIKEKKAEIRELNKIISKKD